MGERPDHAGPGLAHGGGERGGPHLKLNDLGLEEVGFLYLAGKPCQKFKSKEAPRAEGALLPSRAQGAAVPAAMRAAPAAARSQREATRRLFNKTLNYASRLLLASGTFTLMY